MPDTRRRNTACWTCRLRRKKCDASRPACRTCTALNITCHNGDTKPEWMDGAEKQKEMAETLKDEIKKGAAGRREMGPKKATFIVTSVDDYSSASQAGSAAGQGKEPSSDQTISTGPSLSMTTLPIRGSSSSTTIMDVVRQAASTHGGSSIQALGRAWEMEFVMIYLDYVFPFLFPFYHPPVIGTGRAWLLTFIRQSDAVYYSILSLSSYFFIAGLNDVYPEEHNDCKVVVWDQVLKQADQSFEMIQRDLDQFNRRETGVTLLEKARIMESILQLLIFESFLGRRTNWTLHLPPAITIFEDMFSKHHDDPGSLDHFRSVLEEMAWTPNQNVGFDRLIWNPDQASFRFFMGLIIYIDIIASTSLGQAPRLQKYHSLLANLGPFESAVPLDLKSYLGCKNWALITVGEIAVLDAWKKEMLRDGSLSMDQLATRSSQIFQTLDQGLASLSSGQGPMPSMLNNGRHKSYYHGSEMKSTETSQMITRIWALAARAYLSVVLSGWNQENPEVRQSVSQVLGLLKTVESDSQMRALSWPICVAGCLVTGDEERRDFMKLISSMDGYRTLSTIHETKAIVEAVWKKSESGDVRDLDIEACLRILGSPALLV